MDLVDRLAWERWEDARLAPFAMRSALSRGRRHPEEEHPRHPQAESDANQRRHDAAHGAVQQCIERARGVGGVRIVGLLQFSADEVRGQGRRRLP